MTEYSSIIISLATLVIGGGGVLFYDARRRKENALAKSAEFASMKEELSYNRIIITNHIEDLTRLSSDNKELRKDKESLKYKNAKLERQNKGLQNAFTLEVGKKKYAEGFFCKEDECEKRKPKQGTFKTETEKIEE